MLTITSRQVIYEFNCDQPCGGGKYYHMNENEFYIHLRNSHEYTPQNIKTVIQYLKKEADEKLK